MSAMRGQTLVRIRPGPKPVWVRSALRAADSGREAVRVEKLGKRGGAAASARVIGKPRDR